MSVPAWSVRRWCCEGVGVVDPEWAEGGFIMERTRLRCRCGERSFEILMLFCSSGPIVFTSCVSCGVWLVNTKGRVWVYWVQGL